MTVPAGSTVCPGVAAPGADVAVGEEVPEVGLLPEVGVVPGETPAEPQPEASAANAAASRVFVAIRLMGAPIAIRCGRPAPVLVQ